MKYLIPMFAIVLAGCGAQGATFFGTADPCAQGEALHAGFITYSVSNPVSADAKRGERATIVAFRAQCSDGDISKITLTKTLRAYSEALAEWKSGQ